MKPYAFLALMVAVASFIGAIAAIETQPRKPARKEVTHILPRVEDMYENPNPLQF